MQLDGLSSMVMSLSAVTLTFDLLTSKANQHIYEPICICDQDWVKFPSLMFEIWCSQGFQTHRLTYSQTDRPEYSMPPTLFFNKKHKSKTHAVNVDEQSRLIAADLHAGSISERQTDRQTTHSVSRVSNLSTYSARLCDHQSTKNAFVDCIAQYSRLQHWHSAQRHRMNKQHQNCMDAGYNWKIPHQQATPEQRRICVSLRLDLSWTRLCRTCLMGHILWERYTTRTERASSLVNWSETQLIVASTHCTCIYREAQKVA